MFPFLCLNYGQGSPTVCVRGLALRAVALGRTLTLLGSGTRSVATTTFALPQCDTNLPWRGVPGLQALLGSAKLFCV